MSILEVSGIKFKYQDQELYQDASMRLFDGDHAVLVGPNGTGKSTLLKLLAKQLSPDSGSVLWVNNVKVGYLDQYAKLDGEMVCRNYLYDVFLPLFEKEAAQQELYHSLTNAKEEDYEKILLRAQRIADELEASDFYMISSKIGNVINGLGLGVEVLDSKIKYLSGGMRAKLILAKLLLEEADVLLLDEPTNFLDVIHVDWLAKFLNGFPKSFIVVSHDELFLGLIAKAVFALEQKSITRYKGDYNFYLKERELRYQQHQKDYVAQQKFIAKTQDFIGKNITRASTTKRAQSRRKMLEKIVKITKPHVDKKLHFSFPYSFPTGIEVLKVDNLEIGYSEPLVEPLDFIIRKEEKVAITGVNGVGKSTLIKTLVGQVDKLGGSYSWIDTAKIVYFEQDILLDNKYSPFEIIHHENQELTKGEIFAILALFGISNQIAIRPFSTLSGGEKTKVKFALMRNHKSNVLILDEPTNHLDVNSKEALKEALINYPGTLILVSHEKDFYQDICDYEISLI